MERLPEEIVDIIYSFVPINIIYNLNHNHLRIYYPLLIKDTVVDKKFHSYMRYIIRCDCSMFLHKIFEVKLNYFIKLNNWKFDMKTFPNYVEYLRSYAIKLSKTNCRNIIEYHISKEPVSRKKRHKKIRRRNIKWSN